MVTKGRHRAVITTGERVEGSLFVVIGNLEGNIFSCAGIKIPNYARLSAFCFVGALFSKYSWVQPRASDNWRFWGQNWDIT